MKNPNGYGTIIKMTGKRRKPYAVRKTVGVTACGYPKQKYLGYFATLKEATRFLHQYNEGLVNLDDRTVKDVWDSYIETATLRKADTTIKQEKQQISMLDRIMPRKFKDITPMDIQEIISQQAPTMQTVCRKLWKNLEAQAVLMQIPCKRFGDALITTRTETKEKSIFTDKEIKALWENVDKPCVKDALILIYTGLRITEYLTLEKGNIKDNIITCGIKTENGKNRKIPIHPNILPFIEEKSKFAPSERLTGLSQSDLRYKWMKEPLLCNHTFHECRHTFRSRLDNAGANEKCIDLLLGHRGRYVGERVYTHKTIEDLRATILLLN